MVLDTLEILYQDDSIVAINKPNGLLVHRTRMAADEQEHFAVQMLRDQIGQHMYPVHRLDRPTSGVLIMALSSEMASLLKKQFDDRLIGKTYLAVCRGYCPPTGIIDEPLHNDRGVLQDAETKYERLQTVELPIQVSERYTTSRYSLVRVNPTTGRYHQIRKHFAKIRHYLIGDTKHGDLPHNRMFQEYLDCHGLLLHARSLTLTHPVSNQSIRLTAGLPEHFKKITKTFRWNTL
ncbi:MAG: pseudouridine synthase [Bacteroidota bacterium]